MDGIISGVPLGPHTTLGIGGLTKFYFEAYSDEKVVAALAWAKRRDLQVLFVGEGSNLVVGELGFDGLVIKVKSKGIHVVAETSTEVVVEAAAGENWDRFVEWTVDSSFWGCENMSLIPGTVGAIPMQNVGAYGQDASAIVDYVLAIDMTNFSRISFTRGECRFAFRSSRFNRQDKGRYFISAVGFRLSKVPKPNLRRRELRSLHNQEGSAELLQSKIRQRIVNLRSNGVNLPNCEWLGSSGTFFKTCIMPGWAPLLHLVVRAALSFGIRPALLACAFAIRYRTSAGFRLPSKLLLGFAQLEGLKVGSIALMSSNPAVVVTDLRHSVSVVDLETLVGVVDDVMLKTIGGVLPIEPELIGFSATLERREQRLFFGSR